MKRSAPPMGFQMPPEPASISSTNPNPPNSKGTKMPTYPTMQASPQMLHAIKSSRKGHVPAGLAKYLSSHKKGGKK